MQKEKPKANDVGSLRREDDGVGAKISAAVSRISKSISIDPNNTDRKNRHMLLIVNSVSFLNDDVTLGLDPKARARYAAKRGMEIANANGPFWRERFENFDTKITESVKLFVENKELALQTADSMIEERKSWSRIPEVQESIGTEYKEALEDILKLIEDSQ